MVSLVGHLTVVHAQGHVLACALPSCVVNSCSKGTHESRKTLQMPRAYYIQEVQRCPSVKVPVQFVQNNQLHPQQLLPAIAGAILIYEVVYMWN